MAKMTVERQLKLWANGDAHCPNEHGECCPDFSCCKPQLMWPEEQRQLFLTSPKATRELMLLGSLVSFAESLGSKVKINVAVAASKCQRR